MAAKKKVKRASESFHFEEAPGATGRGEEMRNLTQQIMDSFDARAAWLTALRRETAAKLSGVRRELKRKAADLRRFLYAATESRMRDVEGMMSALRQDRQAAAGHWQSMAAALAKRRASPAR